jgi:adenosylcobinamide-phosphate synthase
MGVEGPIILLLGLAIDVALGEPPMIIHPVSWMGKVISFLAKGGSVKAPLVQFVYGCVIVVITIAVFITPVYFLLSYLKGLNLVAYVLTGAALFKITFSLRGLRRAAFRVKNWLAEDKFTEARFELRSLVGRDTARLDKSLMISATVESVAENSCDSFVGPLFFFLFLGVPGAVAYRVINTFDAMIGHHGEFEYLGKFAARLDTVANFIPARITALIMVMAAWICKKNASGAWRIMLRDQRKTESPNAGWTMSAIAGALGVQLEKVGYYKLGDNQNSLSLSTIDASLQIMVTTALIWSLLLIMAEVIYHVTT